MSRDPITDRQVAEIKARTNAITAANSHWRVEMKDDGQWVPVGIPCATRQDAEYLLCLRGGTGLTYRIEFVEPTAALPAPGAPD